MEEVKKTAIQATKVIYNNNIIYKNNYNDNFVY